MKPKAVLTRRFSWSSLNFLGSDLSEALRRFPLPLLSLLLAALLMIAEAHNFEPFGTGSIMGGLIILFLLGGPLLLSVTLLSEDRGWSPLRHCIMALACFSLLALHAFAAPEPGLFLSSPPHLFLGAGLLVLIQVAPFLGRLSDEGSFWQFNRAAGWSLGFAFVVALILFLGLVSAFTTIETLFGGSVRWPYFDIWILCFILFWPWLAVSGLPRTFAVPGADDCPRPVAFVVRSILVPLVLIYLAILYAYMAMILVRWDLPQGQAAYLVSAYGTLGVATHLIAYPLRETGGRLVRLFHRHFYHALVAPLGLLTLAIWIRIEAYGITEPRYGAVLFAVWLAAMTLAFTLPVKRRITWVPLSLSALLLATSFGPWGAFGLSQSSQTAHLRTLLTANGILVDGRIDTAAARVSWSDKKRISSIVAYLNGSSKRDALEPWFADTDSTFDVLLDNREILAAMGLEYIPENQAQPGFTFSQSILDGLDLRGFETLHRVIFREYDQSWSQDLHGGPRDARYRLSYAQDTARLTLARNGSDLATFEFAPILSRLAKTALPSEVAEQMTLDWSRDGLRVRVIVERLFGTVKNLGPRLSQADLIVLIGRDEPAGPAQ